MQIHAHSVKVRHYALCLNLTVFEYVKLTDETTTDVICIHLLWLCIIIAELLVRLSSFKVVHVVCEDGSVADNVTAYLIVNNWAKQFDDLNTAYSLFLSPDGRTYHLQPLDYQAA